MNKFIFLFFFYVFTISITVASNDNSIILTSKNFSKKIESSRKIIVDAWAPWCGPCRKMRPVLDEVVSEKNIELGTLNVDVYPDFAKNQLNISNIPTLIFYKDGIEVKRLVGVFTKDELIYIVDTYFK